MMKELQRFLGDDTVLWQQENIFLGCHTRQITPAPAEEILPYYDKEKQLAITADAGIDNRNELFDRLEMDRSRNQALPDSQLILLGYQKWGEALPEYLAGDFAFMIWDGKYQKLFGARDYSGARTLYYFHNQEHFAFCTLIQPLLSLPYVEKRFNEVWIADFFLADPDRVDHMNPMTTIYKSITQVPPSHSISVCGSTVKIKRYDQFINK
ncbi:hypothetical protein [Oceanobacillus neutriphilus]|nr:hypothetical protein [Oceanobacillus neutriphilus]